MLWLFFRNWDVNAAHWHGDLNSTVMHKNHIRSVRTMPVLGVRIPELNDPADGLLITDDRNEKLRKIESHKVHSKDFQYDKIFVA